MDSAEVDRSKEFAEKVRAAYLEVFGLADLGSGDPDEMIVLGDVVVGIVADYTDGDDALITVRACTRRAARGISVQMVEDWMEGAHGE